MISINRNRIDPPQIPDPKKFEKTVNKLLVEKEKHQFSSHYIGLICKDLKELYEYKCGYCETHTEAGAVLQVDHYRPKNGVKGTSHRGYYWLGYEWTNFIPVCSRCNRAKSNRFPIAANEEKRVKEPPVLPDGRLDRSKCKIDSPELEAEMPLLLHPEVDKPGKHLEFLSSGEVKGISSKGRNTIDICQLNRFALVLTRKQIIKNYLEKIRKHLDGFITKKIGKETLKYCLDELFLEILAESSPGNSYSMLWRFMFQKFDLFFIKPLGAKQQEVLRRYFELFKQEYRSHRKKKTN